MADKTTTQSQWRWFFKKSVLILLGVLAGLLVVEMAIRTVLFVFKGKLYIGGLRFDEKYGWKSTEQFFFEGIRKDGEGIEYPAKIETNSHGFRMFGKTDSSKKKVFIIGDSFCFPEISNDETFFGILKKRLEAEFFVYGCSGFNTTQEFLIYDEWAETIQPDLLVWQFSINDILNNTPELEENFSGYNNGMRRPYFIDDEHITYVLPKSFPWLRRVCMENSKLLYFLITRMNRLAGASCEFSFEDLGPQGKLRSEYLKSLSITEKVLRKVLQKSPSKKVLAFCADNDEPMYSDLKKISEDLGFVFIDGIPQGIRDRETTGVNMRAADRVHWNQKAHQLCADRLLEKLSLYLFRNSY